ncbi:unnamed protein product [Prunus armeniaca]|uniref:Uncharacterized protein n=1 Tax=Prunus armeniaca TaxID=36596 RepID=A0A6J5TTW0_PRUAR|nr:unnamed protein product [Prunus armeniaca]
MHRRLQIVHARVGNSDWWTWAVGMAKEGKGKLCLPKCRSLYQSIDDPISQKTSQRSSPEYHIITISRQGLGHLLKPQSYKSTAINPSQLTHTLQPIKSQQHYTHTRGVKGRRFSTVELLRKRQVSLWQRVTDNCTSSSA